MKIFNSLGSNYGGTQIWQALFGSGRQSRVKLRSYLIEKYKARDVVLTYKGREALQLALKAAKLPVGSAVAINGFTCYAVYRAVDFAGLSVEYLDITPSHLHFTAKTLEKEVVSNKQIKAVIVQNTLGIPCDMKEIEKVCDRYKLVLIEDLAHSVGTHYADGREAGTVGDFAMLSFGRDKLVDAVSGGALIINNPKFVDSTKVVLSKAPRTAVARDRLYPLLTAIVRAGYSIGIGKFLHAGLKAIGLLSKSVDADYYEGHDIPAWQAAMVLRQLRGLSSEIRRRRNLAKLYHENLCQDALSEACASYATSASGLRFPSVSNQRDQLLPRLTRKGINITDIWYDVPVAPARYLKKTTYRHQCPVAEKVCQQIINLPTHRHIKPEAVKKIAEAINQCQP